MYVWNLRKIIRLVLVLCMCCSCSMNSETDNDKVVVTSTSSIEDETNVSIDELSEIPEGYMINIHSDYLTPDEEMIDVDTYEFSSLEFIKDNIRNHTIYSAMDFPILNVKRDFCEVYNMTFAGLEGYANCAKISNEAYVFGDYKESLLTGVVSAYVVTKEAGENLFNGKCTSITFDDLSEIISDSTRIVEFPKSMYVAFESSFGASLNQIIIETDDKTYDIIAEDDYFVMRVQSKEFKDDPYFPIVSMTYFETSEMNTYIHTMFDSIHEGACRN